MKRLLGLAVVFSIIFGLVACSQQNKTSAPKSLLSKDKGKYTLLVVYPNVNNMPVPDFINKLSNTSLVLKEYTVIALKGAKNEYPSLKIKNAPCYIFFNTKKEVFRTQDASKASSFLQKKIKSKQK